MTYTNALQVFFERLNYKHSIKGNTFQKKSMKELDDIVMEEVEEWEDELGTHKEIYELADIMVACTIKLEKILRSEEQ